MPVNAEVLTALEKHPFIFVFSFLIFHIFIMIITFIFIFIFYNFIFLNLFASSHDTLVRLSPSS